MPDTVMNTSSELPVPSRRQLLKGVLAGALAGLSSVPAVAAQDDAPAPVAAEPEMIWENDYPFFGGELPEAYRP